MRLHVLTLAALAMLSGAFDATAAEAATKPKSKAEKTKAREEPRKEVKAEPAFVEISHAELVKAIADKKATVVDACGPVAFKAGHMPGAIDYQSGKGALAEVLPKEKNALIVVYAAAAGFSEYKAAVQAIQALGYKQVKVLAEGFAGWKASGGAVETAP